MKRIIIFPVCFVLVFSGFSQQPGNTNEYYLAKSKMQRKTANVLVGCGLVMFSAGVILSFSGLNKPYEPRYDRMSTAGNIILGIGGATCITGYVFDRAAKRNKKMSVALIIEKMPAIRYGSNMLYQSYPAIGFHLKLGKSK